ncbi:MAG: CDP-glycerol glycerophosphotransferase family protein [Eubacterium sp.]|nr:CDP-glycerol glycerophosphotransferase family protein [Eubacterium sp.]
MNKKLLGYRAFGLFFTIFRVFPVNRNKAFLIATHDCGPEGNIALAARAIQKRRPNMRFVRMTKNDKVSNPFSFFVVKAFHMATSGIILLDNTFMPMAFTPVSKKTKVIQLWHGTGTIKKFGMDSDVEEVAGIAGMGNRRLTWLTVNGPRTKKQYATAFGVSPDRIRMTGLPRTDLMLDEATLKLKKRAFFERYRSRIGEPEKHRYVLYAPTFRDEALATGKPQLMLDIRRLLQELPEDVILMLRFHPAVAKQFSESYFRKEISGAQRARVFDVSGYDGVATLLSVADVLVTDYSSIVFEYAVLKRPMIFYAYDLECFRENGRNFYESYEDFVPGPVVKEEEGLIRELKQALASDDMPENGCSDRIETFLAENFRRIDGHASDRVAALALGIKKREFGNPKRKSRQD